MILHSTLPYKLDIPNPALGYLKGFLESKGIHVKNVYWNLVLFQEISKFKKIMEEGEHPVDLGRPLYYAATVHICKKFLTRGTYTGLNTPLDVSFSLFLPKEKSDRLVMAVRKKIDTYIQENNLCETPLSGFTMKSRQWLMSICLIRRLKRLNPDMKIVIGGIADESQGRTYMKAFPSVDFAIWGEGEYPLYYLAKAVEEGTDVKDVPQLVYREGTKLCSTHESTECPDLDSYPFADHSDYFETLEEAMPRRRQVLIPIWGSRSCPWNRCKFCVLNENYSYRTRSPENIVEEIKFQSEKYNNYSFIFVDTDISGNRKRFKVLLKLLTDISADRKDPYSFLGEIIPLFIDSETAPYMKRASFTSLQVGFEAITDTLLEKIDKRHRFAHNIQVLKIGSQYGLRFDGLNIMKGIPPETEEDILESSSNLKFLRFLLDTHDLNPNLFVLNRGSPFYEEMSEEERKAWNYDYFWADIDSINLIPDSDRFEFAGFHRERPFNILWNDFELAMKSYAGCSYRWIEYDDGSFIEERGPNPGKYAFDRDETDILVFCDSIKSFREVKEKFPHINEESLLEILSDLKEAGFVYYDEDMRNIISILEAWKKEPIPQPL